MTKVSLVKGGEPHEKNSLSLSFSRENELSSAAMPNDESQNV
jgi:hypothetical protein